jgi:AcrR family transcriptional regulator
MSPARVPTRRRPLSRDRVLDAAVRLADQGGLDAVSMRRLGQVLRVDAMALYRHVANKDDVLDGLADLIMGDVEVPALDVDWRTAIRRSAVSAHEVLLRHPWAGALIESRRRAGPARLRYLDGVLGTLAGAGFTVPLALHAIMILDSYTYGFVLQELAWPFETDSAGEVAAAFASHLPSGEYPNLLGVARVVAAEPANAKVDFAVGLDLVLDGVERLRDTARH